jgi:SAM-dependent methyltransferase
MRLFPGAARRRKRSGRSSHLTPRRQAVDKKPEAKSAQQFYDQTYYADTDGRRGSATWHTRRIAHRLGDLRDKHVLDVACGLGEWLELLGREGALLSGIDIAERAVKACHERLPGADVRLGSADSLPWPDDTFDLVTCLGSLEHFADKSQALKEMVRVAAHDARFLMLVPNAAFLTRRLGLYAGTRQKHLREDVYALDVWASLFREAGMVIDHRWRDLHVLDYRWITSGPMRKWPLRATQAAMLPIWPLSWQYQVYHLCRKA